MTVTKAALDDCKSKYWAWSAQDIPPVYTGSAKDTPNISILFWHVTDEETSSKHYYDEKSGVARDYQFARWLVKEIGVAAIPPSAFYSRDNAHLVENFVRFCFCKKEETIRSAGERLQKLKQYLK
ncbi:cysteine conjugate beta-lyase, aminotransferase-like protein [Planoprotostelium fungivorum]|uniref:Cysteine conjugate beta-lyase, aminotransferase-like protein n=1 Tax=Planoprotostelium fungivorum TaxID=1890364 RepID=A0A2P6N5I2_9EUKA|nr:cysteine conjugate beta-lyase, aminotransferase-like protein [Planoprotostelium fungivorum]